MVDTANTADSTGATEDIKDHSDTTGSTAPTSVSSDKQSSTRSRESTSNYASSSSEASRGRPRTRSELSNPLSSSNLEKRGYHTFKCLGHDFHVDKRWKLVRELGQGAYGVVVLAQDAISGENVAIKLVTRIFDKKELAKRALREIVLLRHFNSHENITGLIDMDLLSPDFSEIYLFMEPMEADLHQIIRSGQVLTNAHVQYFLYQILRGCKYIHSANVVHRDLKPGNLLVNADCELKICDLGLSRGFDRSMVDGSKEESVSHMTEYVATRWYRAPEIMLSFRRYGTAIDVWSIGCILGELLASKPMFKGKDYVDQLNLILKTLGTPDEKTIQRIGSEKAQAYIRSLPLKKKVPLKTLFPTADPLAIDLLEKMLAFDPADRITVVDALAHPYLESYHEIGDEPEAPVISERWREIEAIETDFEYRKAIWKEVYDFRLSVRRGDTMGSDEGFPEAEGSVDAGAEGVEVQSVVVEDLDGVDCVQAASEMVMEPTLRGPAVTAQAAAEVSPEISRIVPAIPIASEAAHLPLIPEPTPAETSTVSDATTLPRTSLDPIPFPTVEDSHDYTKPIPRFHGRASSASSATTLRPFSSTRPPSASTTVDPYTAYARRTSLLFTPAQVQANAMLANGGAIREGSSSPSYVIPMRSRAPSSEAGGLVSGFGPLLRTLSTGGLSTLAEFKKLAGEGVAGQITQGDMPPSTLPPEFKKKEKGFAFGSGAGSSNASANGSAQPSPRSGTRSGRSSRRNSAVV
ncbi:hypothetical protein FRB98_003667 [Tulasnella sp. 332]|nr:hypothetical protein FRB98_003667 [Tulasnella sp. 332]